MALGLRGLLVGGVALFLFLQKRVGWGWLLFFAGGISNILDVLMKGAVRDWIPVQLLGFHNNLADWYIAAGVVLILWQLFTKKEKITDAP